MDLRPDPIEEALRAEAREFAAGYIADDGFTARVVAALPPPVEATPYWRRPAIAVMWGVAAAGAALALPGLAVDVGREAFRLLATQPISLPQIAATLAALGLASWAAAAYALRGD